MSLRLTPLRELVNLLEMEQMAQRKLSPEVFARIADGDRRAFDRITFRPRVLVDSTKLDLSLTLLGEKHFAPVLVGPMAGLSRFHADGDAAVIRGAAAAKAPIVTGIAPDKDIAAARARAGEAIGRGAKSICVGPGWDWTAIDQFRKDLGAPLIVKGILSAEEASAAAKNGADAVAVSAWREPAVQAAVAPIEVLPAIVDAVAGKIPVLADGGFRRGTDVFKALAFGARAVMIARPVAWGLAAYGAEGVQYVLEMLQTELGRTMVMCGTPNLAAIGRSFVRIHKR